MRHYPKTNSSRWTPFYPNRSPLGFSSRPFTRCSMVGPSRSSIAGLISGRAAIRESEYELFAAVFRMRLLPPFLLATHRWQRPSLPDLCDLRDRLRIRLENDAPDQPLAHAASANTRLRNCSYLVAIVVPLVPIVFLMPAMLMFIPPSMLLHPAPLPRLVQFPKIG